MTKHRRQRAHPEAGAERHDAEGLYLLLIGNPERHRTNNTEQEDEE